MFWRVLKYAPYLLALTAITAAIIGFAGHERRLGYEKRWAEDFLQELRQDVDQAKLSDAARWRTNGENLHELVGWFVRFNAYARYEAAAAALTAGLADRVLDAERRLQGSAVPGGGACDGAAAGGTEGAEGVGRLRALQQSVYDACGRDGAALETLAMRPVCECPH